MNVDFSDFQGSVLTQVPQQPPNASLQEIYCSFMRPSLMMCMNQKCVSNAFVCDDQKCDCRKPHLKCMKTQTQCFIQNIKSRPVSLQSVERLIEEKIQYIINAVSEFRDKTLKKLRQDNQYFGLSQNQKEFLKNIKKGKPYSINGSTIRSIIQTQEERKQFVYEIINQNIEEMQNIFQKAILSLQQNFQKVTNQMSLCENSVQQFLMVNCQSPPFKLKQSHLCSLGMGSFESNILKSRQQLKTIKQFFEPLTLKSLKLLYRASQNNFEAKKFHEKCDGIKDTLTLVETQFDKKIGGYTPIAWGSINWGTYVKDNSMSSFIFSLTHGDKFKLVNQNQATIHNGQRGPVFGSGYDFRIYNRSNVNDSMANINNSYRNEKYQCNNNQSWQRFCGNPNSSNFKIKQWQVWSVQFN